MLISPSNAEPIAATEGVGAKKASNKKTYSSFAELLRDPGVTRAGTHSDLFCD